jgi:hypothetical protein
MDDITVYSFDLEHHSEHVCHTINLLTENGFRLNITKCKWALTRITFLGHIVDAVGSRVNPAKLADCENWPKPTTGKHIQQFLGFVNYWRDNIPLLSSLTSRLDALRNEKDITHLWTIDHDEDYNRILAILRSGTMLHHADFNYPFFGASDASGTGIGGCVYQIIEGTTRYVLFCSRSLTPAERNYSATKRELLALIYVIRKGRNYFYGAHFEFYTDHAALTYIHSQPKLHPMVIAWFDELAEYNFTINHRPGILNILPDTLSRLYPDANRQYYILNRRVKITPDKSATIVETEDDQLKMLEEKHLLGHFGTTAMINAVRAAGYNWPQITEQASEIVRSCSKCQQFNIVRRGYHPTRPILSKMPGDHLAIDLAGPLPTTDRGNNYLFIAVDICTRFCFLRPMIDKTSATTVTHLIDYCTIFGFPRILQSDNGTEFVNELMKLLKETAGFDHRLITPYHAAANGTAERWVQNALNVIRKMIDGARHDWDLYVPSTQYALNVKIAARHGSTPFSLMFNRSPNGFNDFTGSLGLHPFDGEAYAARIEQFANIVFPAINEKVQKYIDASTKDRHLTSFPDGSFVMTVNKSRTNKLEARYEGPFKVLRRNKGGAYILQDTDGLTLPRNYTTEELKLISHDPDEHGKSYVIERIIQHRGTAPNYEYLVKWKGYTAKYNTWEPTDSFDSTASIDAYWTRLKESQKKKGGDVVTTVRHKTKSVRDHGRTK